MYPACYGLLATLLSLISRQYAVEQLCPQHVLHIHTLTRCCCCRYIKWTQDQYSTQASRKELTQVLEAATKALSSLKRYNDDVRLLRLWVQYVSTVLGTTPHPAPFVRQHSATASTDWHVKRRSCAQ
jgi:hypothetical protein